MRLLELAAKAALKGDLSRHYYLACVVQRTDGAVVVSPNSKVQYPTPAHHAEAKALLKADLGATLYVARVVQDGSWKNARPCKLCQARIRNKGIKKVIYTIGLN